MTPRLANTAAFLGAFLLFLLQPVIAKHLLPQFGGASSVWTASVFFFMTALLAGYLYAYFLSRRTPRAQSRAHTVFICVSVLLVFAASLAWGSPLAPPSFFAAGFSFPVFAILLTLVLAVGVPCALLGATSPLLENWLARTRRRAADFYLYAFSNTGSFLALLAYPFILEPFIPSPALGLLWGVGFFLYAFLMWRLARDSGRVPTSVEPSVPETAQPLSQRAVALWILLPALGSLLLLSATAEITRDIAPVPFLWLLPLALYLLSFIVAFAGAYRREVFAPFALIASVAAVWALGAGADALGFRAALFSGSLFFVLLVCHGEVYLRRDGSRPALFYLCIALGSALGGLLANLAPLFLNDFWELPFALFLGAVMALELTCFAFASALPRFRRRVFLCAVFWSIVIFAAPLLSRVSDQNTIRKARNFYGTLLVRSSATAEGEVRLLRNGVITHGSELVGHPERATTYYGEESGVGIALTNIRKKTERQGTAVGVVGLGAGSLAAYCRSSDSFMFYEINPAVERIAREQFSFLSYCENVEVILGDGRLSLEKETRLFDVLVVDAFSGDAIPMHLLTREAVAAYLARLTEDGVLALHLSNRHIALAPVALGHATRENLFIRFVDNATSTPLLYSSEWALLSRVKLPGFSTAKEARVFASTTPVAFWSDDRSSILPLLRW